MLPWIQPFARLSMDHLLGELQPWSYSVRPAFEYIDSYLTVFLIIVCRCSLQGVDPLGRHYQPLVLGLEQEVHTMKIRQWYGTCGAWWVVESV